jgi:hypothetical protein
LDRGAGANWGWHSVVPGCGKWEQGADKRPEHINRLASDLEPRYELCEFTDVGLRCTKLARFTVV